MIVEQELTNAEWLERWNQHDWSSKVDSALRWILLNPDTSNDDRLAALKILNESINLGLLSRDPSLPEMSWLVLCYAFLGLFKVSWWRRLGLKRRRREISERLVAIQWTLMTASGLVTRSKESAASSSLLAS